MRHIIAIPLAKCRRIVTEDIQLGHIEAQESYYQLVFFVDILIDSHQLQELIAKVGPIEVPTTKFRGKDWRALSQPPGIVSGGPSIRTLQSAPFIDEIVASHKDNVLNALRQSIKFPADWEATLFSKVEYTKDPKALQLNRMPVTRRPEGQKAWHGIFVQVILDTSDFWEKFELEFENAYATGRLASQQVEQAETLVAFRSSLTGLQTFFRQFDPHAGVAMSPEKETGTSYPDPGYDIYVRKGFYERMKEIFGASGDVKNIIYVKDDGTILYALHGQLLPYEVPPPEEPEAGQKTV